MQVQMKKGRQVCVLGDLSRRVPGKLGMEITHINLLELGLAHPRLLGLGEGAEAAAQGGLCLREAAILPDLLVGHSRQLGLY